MLIAMRRLGLSVALWTAVCGVTAASGPVVDARFVPTGQRLSPMGAAFTFGGHPLDVAVSRAGLVAVKYSGGLLFVDSASGRTVQTLPLTREHVHYPQNLGGNGLVGIAWNLDGTTVWSADGFGLLRSATRGASGTFAWDTDVELPGPSGRFRDPKTQGLDPAVPTGVAVSEDGAAVFVASELEDKLFVVDAARRAIVATIRVGVAPFALLRSGRMLYVTNLGGDKPAAGERSGDSGGDRVRTDARGIAATGALSVIDTASRSVVATVELGRHPETMALSRDGKRLFVANANDDTIAIIDTSSNAVLRTIALPLQSGFGANASALAVSPVNGRLYVAEGGDNRVLALDGSSYAPVGEISTGWYPDAIAFAADGSAFVASLKGFGSRGSAFGFRRHDLGFRLDTSFRRGGFNVYDYTGLVQILRPGTLASLPPATSSSHAFFKYIPDRSPAYLPAMFKHVVFIIKENHTYDDYFGDIPGARGDPAFCAFPQRISPNHHALARRFGLYDNFYVNGTMSGDGHQWTDEAGTTDYVERNTASWAKTYPSDGTDPLAYLSTGFIWQRVLDRGGTFRDYGEFIRSEPAFVPENATWSQFWADRKSGTHTVAFKNVIQLQSLVPYVDPKYAGFSLRVSDQARADEILRELKGFETAGKLPSLIVMELGVDHTAGTDPGYPVPASAVADNDLALGRIVEGISHSKFWNDTAIFAVEDDAQNGIDHVDGHRTAALVVSAHNRPHRVDSHFYDQTSILRTIELILKLRPLTQFDAHAPPIVDAFDPNEHQAPYTALPNRVPLDTLNPKTSATSYVNVDVPDAFVAVSALASEDRYFRILKRTPRWACRCIGSSSTTSLKHDAATSKDARVRFSSW
jgi:YVTN family beta-propeller protein